MWLCGDFRCIRCYICLYIWRMYVYICIYTHKICASCKFAGIQKWICAHVIVCSYNRSRPQSAHAFYLLTHLPLCFWLKYSNFISQPATFCSCYLLHGQHFFRNFTDEGFSCCMPPACRVNKVVPTRTKSNSNNLCVCASPCINIKLNLLQASCANLL